MGLNWSSILDSVIAGFLALPFPAFNLIIFVLGLFVWGNKLKKYVARKLAHWDLGVREEEEKKNKEMEKKKKEMEEMVKMAVETAMDAALGGGRSGSWKGRGRG
ncbi:uncharacterized protein N0V89_003419 [Didymosphaeria variabile]|uniref:Uncharacterized protein n=1 Tax=Didymosphaeria variabile TaxID=1932322 RepID=A0A9W9CCA3_9PLEO|nr:uncharacterized protein N0V89_003419 [Didymosphaeria variabile]KAJ4355403.1 hypothetical protein N0V89_003419 [Didymosphaeria variabile]